MYNRCVGVVALILMMTATVMPSQGVPARPEAGIEQLAWMAGCWNRVAGERRIDEQWMKPLGGSMLGMSRTVNAGRTVEWEFLAIRQEGTELVFVARPSGQPEATFKMTAISADEVRFENPAHDFPQRIIYKRVADGSLHARVEGTLKGQARGVDFPMTRGGC